MVPFVAAMAASVAAVGIVVAALARRGVASPLLTAAAWAVMEALRGRAPLGGFPWADVGVALHGLAPARALAGFGGVALVGFVAVALAGYLADLATAITSQRRRALALASAGAAAMVVVGAVAQWARYEGHVTGRLRVAILQGNDRQLSLRAQQRQLLTDEHFALAEQLRGRYDLIVFPETSLDTDPETDSELGARIAALARRHDAYILANARTPASQDESGRLRYRNTNLLYDPDGALAGAYSKQHLVPFGEYVPWRGTLGFLGELRQIPYDFEAGHEAVVFRVGWHRVGTVVCFESAFGPLVREFVRAGAEAIVVSTNNRSYRRSGNSAQHLANSRMRAAETARPVVQASLSGISAVIDADGAVRHKTGLFEKAIVTTTVATTTGETPYVRFGDWVVFASALALVVAAVVAARRAARGAPTPVASGVDDQPDRGDEPDHDDHRAEKVPW